MCAAVVEIVGVAYGGGGVVDVVVVDDAVVAI